MEFILKTKEVLVLMKVLSWLVVRLIVFLFKQVKWKH